MTQHAHSSEVLMHLDTKMQNVKGKSKERSHVLNTLLLKMKSEIAPVILQAGNDVLPSQKWHE